MTYDSVLAALADPTRRKVFEAVAAQPHSVSDLAGHLPVSRPAVSQHLKVLSDAGLVTCRREGTRRIYAARREGLADLRAYLDDLWGDVLRAFQSEVANERKKDG